MTSTASAERLAPPLGQATFWAASALLFLGSGAATVAWCMGMSPAGGMPMPGGWTMSMAWMRMPGQSWPDATATFLGMWTVMMVAMMLPSFVPMLTRYRRTLGAVSEPRLGRLTALAGSGYFLVWAAFGAVVYPLGVTLAALEMRFEGLSRAAPIAAGVVVVAAGLLQLTAWKARHLHCCRSSAPLVGVARAWRHGVRLGLHCSACCAGFVAILLVAGVMDLAAMAIVTAAITVERVAPSGERIARATGIAAVAAGALLLARALG